MTQPIKYESEFAKEIYALENGQQIKKCMQCGMCDVSCATKKEMDYSPRELFMLLRTGNRDEFYKANTMWMCSTCLMCKVRCPRGIALVDVMHDLKAYAIKQGRTKPPQAAFYQAFCQDIMSRGRLFMGGLMARYYLKRGWTEMVKAGFEMKDLGLKMVMHSRIPMKPPKGIKGLKGMRAIVERAQELVGEEVKG